MTYPYSVKALFIALAELSQKIKVQPSDRKKAVAELKEQLALVVSLFDKIAAEKALDLGTLVRIQRRIESLDRKINSMA